MAIHPLMLKTLSPGYSVGRYLISSEILDRTRVKSRDVDNSARNTVRWLMAYCTMHRQEKDFNLGRISLTSLEGLRVQPSTRTIQVLLLRISVPNPHLLADTVVWPMAKHQEIGRVLDVLLALRAEAIWVKLLCVDITLKTQQDAGSRGGKSKVVYKLAVIKYMQQFVQCCEPVQGPS